MVQSIPYFRTIAEASKKIHDHDRTMSKAKLRQVTGGSKGIDC